MRLTHALVLFLAASVGSAETFVFRDISVDGAEAWTAKPHPTLGDEALRLVSESRSKAVFITMGIPEGLDEIEFRDGYERGFIKDRKVLFTNPIRLSGIEGKLIFVSGSKRDSLILTFVIEKTIYLGVFQSEASPSNLDQSIQELIKSIKLATK